MRRRFLAGFILVAIAAAAIISLPRSSPDLVSTGSLTQSDNSPRVPESFSYTSIQIAGEKDGPVAKEPTNCAFEEGKAVLGSTDAEMKEEMLELVSELGGSRDADHLLAAAVMSQWDGSAASFELLDRASLIVPAHPLVAWSRLSMCRDREGADCDLTSAEASAISVDGDNGAVWLGIAIVRLQQNRHDDAAAAVRQAIAAPRFDNYFVDYAIVLERALSIRADSSYRDRMTAAIGISAALVVSYYTITQHCRAIESDDAMWIELCDQIGEQMFVKGRALMDQAIGRSLQKTAAKKSGDESRIVATATAEAEFRAFYRSLAANSDQMGLLANDEAVLRKYIQDFATYGEQSAQTRLRTEAARLKELPGYDKCNFVNRPYAL